MPNPWDVGSAVRLQAMGFSALATTSSGHAASLGKVDQQVTADEMLDHAAQVVAAVDVPVNVDSERLFAETPSELADMISALADTGAAGCSIEDYDPSTQTIDPIEVAVARVEAAAAAASDHGIVLTARAEGLLYGIGDVDEIVDRLAGYRRAGADVIYSPGLTSPADISRVLSELDAPMNYLLRPNGPDPTEAAGLGVRRISIGGALAMAAYSGMESQARQWLL